MAVRGFFANGGKRCVVLPVPYKRNSPYESTRDLLDVLQRGGILEDRTDIDLICVPDAVSPLVDNGDNPYEIHAAALAHCEAMGDRFAILDAQDDRSSGPQALVNEVLGKASPLRSAFGALYFPWIAQ